MSGAPPQAVHVRVEGVVQGVSFRYHTSQQARREGAVGWVRNLPDGSVEAHVQGDPAVVDRVVAWMRRGPREARVERLTTTAAPLDATLSDFATRR